MKNKYTEYSLEQKVILVAKIIPFKLILGILLFSFLPAGSVSAQDLLILKTGKELKVTIVEENAEFIKYREFEDPQGPLYSITRDKIAELNTVRERKNALKAKRKIR